MCCGQTSPVSIEFQQDQTSEVTLVIQQHVKDDKTPDNYGKKKLSSHTFFLNSS